LPELLPLRQDHQYHFEYVTSEPHVPFCSKLTMSQA
jgi:hypothetical protein